MIFVNSMSDLFHDDVPDEYILRVFDAMHRAGHHTYQILTKRSERLARIGDMLPWAPHIWMGVSVEDADYTGRIDDLRKTSAHLKFLSVEPLLGPLPGLDLDGIDWVIVGGESGPGARPMDEAWVTDIRDQCHEQGARFFFKQWGGVNKKKAGRELAGKTWDDMPPPPDRARASMPQLRLRLHDDSTPRRVDPTSVDGSTVTARGKSQMGAGAAGKNTIHRA